MKNILLTVLLLTGALQVAAEAYYWVGGTGNWSDPAHWSLDDDGTNVPANAIPTAADNVYFNEYSFTGTTDTLFITAQDIFCKEMDWTALNARPVLFFNGVGGLEQRVSVSGSLILSELLSIAGAESNWILNAAQQNNVLITAGLLLDNVKLDNELGSWTLLDELNVRGTLRLNTGALTTLDNNINCAIFDASGNNIRKLNLGNSIITASSTVEMNADNFTCSPGTSKLVTANLMVNDIELYDVTLISAEPKIIGNNIVINNLEAGEEVLPEFQGGNSGFTSLAPQLVLPAGSALTLLGDLIVNSVCESRLLLISSVSGTQSTLIKPSGTVDLREVRIQDINATGGAVFSAVNSFDDGNNSGWTIIEPEVPCELPVILTHFDASCKNRNVSLNWTTETEVNCDYFSVQRSSTGEDFNEIIKIAGAGTTEEIQEYHFTDITAQNGTNYYRLQQVDFDGTATYSDVIATTCSNLSNDFQVYPNPVRNSFNLEINLVEDCALSLRISDLQGKPVQRAYYETFPAGYHTIPIDFSSLLPGMYIVEVYINEQFLQKKLMKL